jgi:hypothetical protein
MRTVINKGMKFSRLTVIKEVAPYVAPNTNKKRRKFLFKCDCGNKVETTLYRVVGKNPNTLSCGCVQKERASKAAITHGLSHKDLYKVWKNMMSRCYSESAINYDIYGGRGIKVTKSWRSNPEGLMAFIDWAILNGYKRGLEIDRKDNNNGYSPKNCRFVTRLINSYNRRTTIYVKHPKKNTLITFREAYNEMSNKKVSYATARLRYTQLKWPLLDCLTMPRNTIYNRN